MPLQCLAQAHPRARLARPPGRPAARYLEHLFVAVELGAPITQVVPGVIQAGVKLEGVANLLDRLIVLILAPQKLGKIHIGQADQGRARDRLVQHRPGLVGLFRAFVRVHQPLARDVPGGGKLHGPLERVDLRLGVPASAMRLGQIEPRRGVEREALHRLLSKIQSLKSAFHVDELANNGAPGLPQVRTRLQDAAQAAQQLFEGDARESRVAQGDGESIPSRRTPRRRGVPED